jgi:ankyrin repeat protein
VFALATERRAAWALALLAVVVCSCRRSSPPPEGRAAPEAKADGARLLRAADAGEVESVRRLVEGGAPLEDVDGRGHTPLIHAVRGGHGAVVDLLLQRGARIDHADYSGQTPLMAALASGRAEVARQLLDRGARPDDELPPWSALRLAAFVGADVAVDALLERGVKPDGADHYGMTALMYAAGRGHEPIVRRLLAKGADADRADRRGHTALMFAAGSGQAEVVRALLDAGAEPAARNRGGQTAREMAAANGHSHVFGAQTASAQGTLMPAAARAAGPPGWNEDAAFRDAARTAWAYVQAHYRPATGLVDASEGWANTTMWDVGSTLAAYYSARELSLLPDAEYKARVARVLRTLSAVPLFDGITYDRQYPTRAVGRGPRAGWSPTDLGRLFLWLRIIGARDPELAAAAEAAVRRTKTDGVLRDGFMWGLRAAGGERRQFQEGRIGYEQYAAAGFSNWGLPVQHASVLTRYALPMRIMGQPVLADLRGDDRLTSDPIVMLGMEVGWTREAQALAQGLLAAQQERWRRSGRVTIVGEDAISLAPHNFFYYCAYTHGREFAVDVQDPDAVVKGPRWVSTKNAFAWHALLPSDYTRLAVATVRPAAGSRGWASGVYEDGGGSTRTNSINTQAVILEAAVFRRTRTPFLAVSAGAPGARPGAGGEGAQEEP